MLKTIVAFAAGGILVATANLAVAADLAVDRYYPAEGVDLVAECLLAQGYRGIAGDGEEAIYAPTSAIERCTTTRA